MKRSTKVRLRKIIKCSQGVIKFTCFMLGLIIIVGTAGSSDCGLINEAQIIERAGIAFGIWLIGFII